MKKWNCQNGRKKMFWLAECIGVPVAAPIPLWAVLCQLSRAWENAAISLRASTFERSGFEPLHAHGLEVIERVGDDLRLDDGRHDRPEMAHHAVVEQQEPVPAGLRVPGRMDRAQPFEEPAGVLRRGPRQGVELVAEGLVGHSRPPSRTGGEPRVPYSYQSPVTGA